VAVVVLQNPDVGVSVNGTSGSADAVHVVAEASPSVSKSQPEGGTPSSGSADAADVVAEASPSVSKSQPEGGTPSSGVFEIAHAESVAVRNSGSGGSLDRPVGGVTALIQELSPLPKSKTSRKRTREVEGAEVVTGSSYKQRILEKALQKSKKSEVKDKKPRKKVTGSPYKQRVQEKSLQKSKKSEVKDEAPRKKKLKCRLDKPRGRRPVNRGSKKATHLKETKKSSLIKARSGKGKSQGQGSREADDDDTPCMYCGEKYGDSVPGEQWL